MSIPIHRLPASEWERITGLPHKPSIQKRAALPPEPSFAGNVARLWLALRAWRAAGYPVASFRLIAQRRATCRACVHPDGRPMFDQAARLGLGKCRHHACGCTRLKWWLATETCPLSKWPA